MTYDAELWDPGSLSESITFVATIQDAYVLLERAGLWTPSPDGGGDILLSDGARIVLSYRGEPCHELTINENGAVCIGRGDW